MAHFKQGSLIIGDGNQVEFDDSGQVIMTYDSSETVLTLSVNGSSEAKMVPVLYGTGASPPAGTYPEGTVYYQYS